MCLLIHKSDQDSAWQIYTLSTTSASFDLMGFRNSHEFRWMYSWTSLVTEWPIRIPHLQQIACPVYHDVYCWSEHHCQRDESTWFDIRERNRKRIDSRKPGHFYSHTHTHNAPCLLVPSSYSTLNRIWNNHFIVYRSFFHVFIASHPFCVCFSIDILVSIIMHGWHHHPSLFYGNQWKCLSRFRDQWLDPCIYKTSHREMLSDCFVWLCALVVTANVCVYVCAWLPWKCSRCHGDLLIHSDRKKKDMPDLSYPSYLRICSKQTLVTFNKRNEIKPSYCKTCNGTSKNYSSYNSRHWPKKTRFPFFFSLLFPLFYLLYIPCRQRYLSLKQILYPYPATATTMMMKKPTKIWLNN